MTDKDRARLIGRANAQVNRTGKDELMALHMATGIRIARLAGLDEDEAIQVASSITLALIEVMPDKTSPNQAEGTCKGTLND